MASRLASAVLNRFVKVCSLSARGIYSTPVALRNEDNPFYEKYKDKLSQVIGDEPLPTSVARQQRTHTPNSGQKLFSYTASPSLDSIMKVELILDKSPEDIAMIWEDYHKTKDCVGGVMPAHKYVEMFTKASHCPLFVYPVPRGDGVEMVLAQFSGHKCYFTSLINYQVHGENAPVSLTLSHFIELQESKGIVLMLGEIDMQSLSVLEAQFLANQVQLYYASSDNERYAVVRQFNHDPQNFDYQVLLQQLNGPQITAD